MKGKKILIGSVIINILLVGIVCNFINRNYLNNDKLILKTMTETEYESEIDSLNESYQNYQKYITDSKTELATAITNKGVETASTSTFETMATNINSIVTNPDASSISYDNTSSGLTSSNVQSAVDEIDSEIDELNGALNTEYLCGTKANYNLRLYKQLNRVYLEVGTYSSWAQIETLLSYTLSEGYRPKETIRIPAIVADSSSKRYIGEVIINADGTFRVVYFSSYASDIGLTITTGYFICNGSFSTV